MSPSAAAPAATPSGAAATPSAPVASPSSSASSGPATEPSPPPPDPVLVGVGDIATCDHDDDEQTAALIAGLEGIVFTLGDNAYDRGSSAEFRDCYDPSWGRVKDRTEFPVAGNHDWDTRNAAGYREYFGERATPHGVTWYSRDVGAWHVIVLDANCTALAVGAGRDLPELRWLRQDLAASDASCTLAMWHQPRFSSGEHGNDKSVAPFLDRAPHAAGPDLILNGHDHDFERFAPQDPDGNRDERAASSRSSRGPVAARCARWRTRSRTRSCARAGSSGVLQPRSGRRAGTPLHPDRRLLVHGRKPRDVSLTGGARIAGHVVGRVTSGGYGFSVGRSIAYAYLPPDVAIGTRGEVDVFGTWVGFEVAREPLFDPAGSRIRS